MRESGPTFNEGEPKEIKDAGSFDELYEILRRKGRCRESPAKKYTRRII